MQIITIDSAAIQCYDETCQEFRTDRRVISEKVSPKDLCLWGFGAGSGIRTHAALLPNGFQDRLVMTTSISLHRCGKAGSQKVSAVRCPISDNGVIISYLRENVK